MKRSELKPDPDKVREFIQRNRKPLKRTPPKRYPRIPGGIRKHVLKRSGYRCVVCGCKDRAMQLHHVLPKRLFDGARYEPKNLVALCPGCHDAHERAHRRIRWDELPEGTRTWIQTLGGRESLYLERTYPR